MKIGKPILLVVTPVGVAIGFSEAIRQTGGLAILFTAFIVMFGAAMAGIVATIRREAREEREAAAAPAEAGKGPGDVRAPRAQPPPQPPPGRPGST